MAFTFQGQLNVSWRWRTFRATKHQQMTENIKKILEFIHEDHCQTIHELTDTVGISYGVCQEILTENLNVCYIAAKFVPRLLTNDLKQWHISVCLELWDKANENAAFTSISRIITSDKSWIFRLWFRNKATVVAVEEPTITKSKKGTADPESSKDHAHCFFDLQRIGHRKFVPSNTVTFWDAWEKMCDEKDWNFGATTTGSFITTMCLPTRPWIPQSLWLITTWLSFPILPNRWS
jgi:hypothetical protein